MVKLLPLQDTKKKKADKKDKKGGKKEKKESKKAKKEKKERKADKKEKKEKKQLALTDKKEKKEKKQPKITDTEVWLRLESMYRYPAEVINALYMVLAQYFGEEKATELFGEEWLAACTDRWLAFSIALAAKRPTDESLPVLPCVLEEFQVLAFAIVRFVSANSRLASSIATTDRQQLHFLSQKGFTLLGLFSFAAFAFPVWANLPNMHWIHS